eukprot:246608-Amorphochlora_amoeboformis.AAC.1
MTCKRPHHLPHSCHRPLVLWPGFWALGFGLGSGSGLRLGQVGLSVRVGLGNGEYLRVGDFGGRLEERESLL